MIIKQLIRYTNADAIEATWVDENDVVIKCQAYSNHPEQMAMLRADLGADAAQYERLIAEVEATYVPPEPIPLTERQAAVWEAIKSERDRRASLGVKVGSHWFHSDQKSRIQQMGLVLLGASTPAGVQWKTLTLTPPPVFVAMTPALARAIVAATAASDTAIFTAAEAHRLVMEASEAPQDYDFSTGWPTSIEEEANAAGITFDQSLADRADLRLHGPRAAPEVPALLSHLSDKA